MSSPPVTSPPPPAPQRTLLASAARLYSNYRRGIFDVLVLMIPDFVSIGTATVTSILLARGLGAARLGAYALVQSVIALATSLSNLGIGVAAIRYAAIAYARGDIDTQLAVLRWAFRIRMLLLGFVTLLLFFLAPLVAVKFWHLPELTLSLRLGLLGAIFTSLELIPTVYFQSMRSFNKNTVIAVGESVVTMLGIVYIHFAHLWSVNNVLIATLLTGAVGTLLFVGMAPRSAFVPPNWWKSKELWSSTFWRGPGSSQPEEIAGATIHTFAFYNFLATVVSMVALRIDVWLMGRYLKPSELGIYSAAARFMVPLQILSSGINNAITPRASACKTLGDTATLLRSMLKMGALVLVGTTIYSLAAPSVAPIVFGHEYGPSAMLGRFLCIGQAIALLFAPIGIIGYNLGLVKHYSVTNLVQLIVVIAVLCWGLPRYGALAAAFAFIANALSGAVINSYLIYSKTARHSTNASTE